MRKTIRRIVCMTAALLVLLSLAPVPVRAVDPVSAATMANALAQAITAYGASNGVSMMYDVTDTSGIGEGVHDLWDQFKDDINDNDVPTYDSLAVTTWSTIYKKVGNSVAINLSDTVVSYLDRFWNWLLSGPAEMQKVDDQYYQWTLDQNGNVSPISVLNQSFYLINGYQLYTLPIGTQLSNGTQRQVLVNNNANVAAFAVLMNPGAGDALTLFLVSLDGTSFEYKFDTDRYWANSSYLATSRWYYGIASSGNGGSILNDMPVYPFIDNSISSYLGDYNPTGISAVDAGIGIRPYVGAETPENVYIPDNDDVNYQPLPYVGPLNIPWQNAWGDGETIDDAGAQDIADALDQQIVDDGTLQLEGDNTVNPPIDDVIGGPDDYQVPGLADVFPFCIPFDIYNFLSALAADPVAPHFTAQLDFPEAIGGTQTIDIDFDSPTWNQLAQLLRLLELLAFIVGLALLTRSMFIRG